MLDSELHQYLAYTEFLLKSVDLPHLLETLKESSAGYPTGHEGTTELDENGEAVTYDSRTESAALHSDPARDTRKAIERDVKALRNAAVNLHGAWEAWSRTTTNRPIGTQAAPGCRSCKRLKVTRQGQTVDKWVPCRELPGSTREKPRYDERCQFCADWNRGEGQDPPVPVLTLHHDKGRVTSADLNRLGIKTKTTARERRRAC